MRCEVGEGVPKHVVECFAAQFNAVGHLQRWFQALTEEVRRVR